MCRVSHESMVTGSGASIGFDSCANNFSSISSVFMSIVLWITNPIHCVTGGRIGLIKNQLRYSLLTGIFSLPS